MLIITPPTTSLENFVNLCFITMLSSKVSYSQIPLVMGISRHECINPFLTRVHDLTTLKLTHQVSHSCLYCPKQPNYFGDIPLTKSFLQDILEGESYLKQNQHLSFKYVVNLCFKCLSYFPKCNRS